MWDKVTSTQNDDAWFEDYCRIALACEPPKLPERIQRLGSVAAGWFPTLPGTAHVFATGGTSLDRAFAFQVIAAQLEGHGIKPASYSLDWDLADETLIKEAGWPDIQAKATRLIKSGKVKITGNARDIVTGVVEGDHGTYNTEVQRQDPESQSISMWSCECSVAGNMIVMADGTRKAVEDIEVGDRVLTALGTIGVVGHTMNRHYDGDIFGFCMGGSSETIWVTGKHRLLTPEGPKEAKDWEGDDCTFLPQPILGETKAIRVSDFVSGLIEQDGWLYKPNKLFGSNRVRKESRPISPLSPHQKPIPVEIAFDENFARLAGLFVAEGMATPRGELRWAFNANEPHLANEMVRRLGAYGIDNAQISQKGNSLTVAVQAKPLADLFVQLFGTGSHDKKLHPVIMAMPKHILSIFFDAWVEGDGHRSKNGVRYLLATVSDNLAMQARLILSLLGCESVIRRKEKNSSPLVPNGGPINYVIWRTNQTTPKKVTRRFEESKVVQQMRPIARHHFTGTVYNFEVLEEHSYVFAPGIASLNCKWDQFAWQRTRQWKKYEGRTCSHVLATYWQGLSLPFDEDIGPGAGEPQPEGGEGGAAMVAPGQSEQPAPEPQPSPFAQVPGGGTGMVPPAGTSGPQKPGLPNQTAPTPEPAGGVPGQAPEPRSLIPQYPHDPALQPAVNPVSVPGQKPQTPLNPIQNPGGTFSHIAAQQFTNGDMVQLKQADFGQTVGLNAGETKEVPANSIGEILGVDPLGLVNVYYAGPQGEAGRMEPHGVTAWHWPKDIIPRPDLRKPGPATRRR